MRNLVLLIVSLLLGLNSGYPVEKVKAIIARSQQEILAKQTNNTFWMYPAYLGTNYISTYYVLNFLVSHENDTLLDKNVLRKIILDTQMPDGSWQNVAELNKDYGELDTTIYHYWALKVMGENPDTSPTMIKARAFVRKNGGFAKTQTMTKFWLCLFGNYDWDDTNYIPLFVFHRQGLLSWLFVKYMVAQWVFPHLLPMTYARATHLAKDLGPRFSIKELNPTESAKTDYRDQSFLTPSRSELEMLVERMLEIQQPHGGFGAYSVSSIFSIICFQDFVKKYPDSNLIPRINVAVPRAFSFIELLYFKSGEGAYKGVLDDGRYWDTALAALSLAESNIPAEKLMATFKYFAESQLPSGGIPYGIDFEYAPDTDDTAMAVVFMCKIGMKDSPTVQNALKWLKSMQNSDGGFAAFDKNRQGNFLVKYFTSVFTDSSEAFDPSCVDLAGHILEAFATCGVTLSKDDSGMMQDAVDYIEGQETDFGGWEARWGVNYIYAAGAALPGLKRAGVDMRKPWIARAVEWLVTRQNLDGGFGESTLSYSDVKWAGKGVSTPSQTAWALLGLIDVADTYEYVKPAMERAVDYLVREFERRGSWVDDSSVGTGHRKILYMQYPAYSHTFPLIALARYLKLE